MKKKALNLLALLVLSSITSCGQNETTNSPGQVSVANENEVSVSTEPHSYGGWYCPDNIYGFPAVDIADWQNVPVVNGRMATKEETQNGTSLIFVDAEKYPNAKPLDLTMPKLARYYNHSSDRNELIIVIQAINVDNDSVVGFRYLNGGNGSAWLNEIELLSDGEINAIPDSRFVSQTIEIKASQDEIWKIITDEAHLNSLQPIFNENNKLENDWRAATNVNYHYLKSGEPTALYADKLFGSYYVQNDYTQLDYTEKFFLMENAETGITELNIVCGPFAADFQVQKTILENWGNKVKELSE